MRTMLFSALAITVFTGSSVSAAEVTLQNATATYSQGTAAGEGLSWAISQTIDGVIADKNGWAIWRPGTQSETAAFETTTNVGYSKGTLLTFNLYQDYDAGGGGLRHLLGKFRLSVTQADRTAFADGLQTNGNVGDPSIWTHLHPLSAISQNGATLTINSDNTIFSGGFLPGTDTYTVMAATTLTNITGFRLEALQDPLSPQ